MNRSLGTRVGFVLGIGALVVAPAATLIVLGARGLERERAQRAAEQREAARALGDEAVRRLRAILEAPIAAFAERIATALPAPAALGAALSSWAEGDARIALAFVAAPDGALLSPDARPVPLKIPGPLPPALARLLARLRREIGALGHSTSTPDALLEAAAETAEAYLRAARAAGQLKPEIRDRAHAELRFTVAGAYAERGDLSRAMMAYEQLAKEGASVTTARGVPVALRARLAAAGLALRRGDPHRALQAMLRVETQLALGRYNLSAPLRDGLLFAASRLGDRLRVASARDPELALALGRGEDRLDRLRRFLPVYLRSVAPELSTLWREQGPLRLMPRAEGEWRYVFCQRVPDADRIAAGFALSAPGFVADAAAQLEGLAVGARGRLRVLDPRGAPLFTVGSPRSGADDSQAAPLVVREQRPISKVLPGFALEVETPAGQGGMAGGEGRLRLQAAALTGAALLLALGLALTVGAALHRVRLARLRTELVHNVSHELRTPLTTIRMYGEILRDGGLGDEQQAEYFEVIVGESERLQAMIESVLDFARLERGGLALDRRPTDLAALVGEVVEAFRPRLEREGFEVSFEASEALGPVDVDPVAIRRVVWNLIANAAAYSQKTRRVSVGVNREGGRVRVAVKDRGVGMSPEVQRRLFTPFFRAEALAGAKRPAGIGLGLALSRELMRLHGGGVEVTSALGRGSTITAWLPAALGKEREGAAPGEGGDDG